MTGKTDMLENNHLPIILMPLRPASIFTNFEDKEHNSS